MDQVNIGKLERRHLPDIYQLAVKRYSQRKAEFLFEKARKHDIFRYPAPRPHSYRWWEDDYNMELSKERAAAVRDYLVSQGVDPARMVTKGMGETMPIADNTTRAGRAANRRVQVLVLGRTR